MFLQNNLMTSGHPPRWLASKFLTRRAVANRPGCLRSVGREWSTKWAVVRRSMPLGTLPGGTARVWPYPSQLRYMLISSLTHTLLCLYADETWLENQSGQWVFQ
jgi:hypothetical protein